MINHTSNKDRTETPSLATVEIINSIKSISLTSHDKERLYAPRKTSLVIKLLGKRILHQYLKLKIQELWKSFKNFPLIDLGLDYYIIEFSLNENMDNALLNGPWFINGHQLSARKGEPYFRLKTQNKPILPFGLGCLTSQQSIMTAHNSNKSVE